MPINTTLADTSNGLLLSTVVIYAIAMLCYACDFAFAKHRVLGDGTEKAATVAAPELASADLVGAELVGAGAGAGAAAGAAGGSGRAGAVAARPGAGSAAG